MLRNVRSCLQSTVDAAECRKYLNAGPRLFKPYDMISVKRRYFSHSDGKYRVRPT